MIASRLQLWRDRLSPSPPHNQYILLSEHNGEIQGFACAYLDADPQWGTLLDNLHVDASQKGRGLGARLMATLARKLQEDGSAPALHLWVYEQNLPARRFYERMGGVPADRAAELAPDGRRVNTVRYAWRQLAVLVQSSLHG